MNLIEYYFNVKFIFNINIEILNNLIIFYDNIYILNRKLILLLFLEYYYYLHKFYI